MRRSLKLSASLLLFAFAGAQVAQAVEFAQRDPEFPPRVYTCRFNGGDVPLGGLRCLKTAHGERIAQCGISLNMSSWRQTDDFCP